MPSVLEWFLAGLLVLLGMMGSSDTVEAPPIAHPAGIAAPGVAVQAASFGDPTLDLLAYVPDTVETRKWLTLGDAEAWHQETGVPRIYTMEEARALPEDQFDLWALGAPGELMPPAALGIQYLQVEDLREFIGFNYFDAIRFVEAGNPPDTVSVITVQVSPPVIADTLLANGYEGTRLDGAMLYAKGEDYRVDLLSPSLTGRLGTLNRVAVLDAPPDAATTTVIVAKATHLVAQALAASQGESLAVRDPSFAAVTTALAANTPEIPGALTGLLFLNEAPLLDPLLFLGSTPEEAAVLLEELTTRLEASPLSPWRVNGLATHRDGDDLYLSALLAFLPGADVETEAAMLAERMATYEDPDWAQPFSERWSLFQQSGMTIDGIPVAWVTMKVAPREWNALQWAYLVMRRDIDFLIPAGAP